MREREVGEREDLGRLTMAETAPADTSALQRAVTAEARFPMCGSEGFEADA